MFTSSIRWRLQLWLAFLLICVLSGFGVTVHQLQRVHQLNQIDEELGRRVAALSTAVRGGGPPPNRGPGWPPFENRPGKPEFDDGPNRPPPRGRPEFPPPDGRREMRPGPREVRLSPEALNLFDETNPNAFYFAVWSRDGTVLRHSTNAPAELPQPRRLAGDTRTHTREREAFRLR